MPKSNCGPPNPHPHSQNVIVSKISKINILISGIANSGYYSHIGVTTYDDFRRRVLERFDKKDPKEKFGELTKLKQTGSPKTYIFEFLRLSVMVPDLSEPRKTFMFIDGLAEPLRGLVRSTRPITLQDIVGRTWDLHNA